MCCCRGGAKQAALIALRCCCRANVMHAFALTAAGAAYPAADAAVQRCPDLHAQADMQPLLALAVPCRRCCPPSARLCCSARP